MGKFKNSDIRASVTRIACPDRSIPIVPIVSMCREFVACVSTLCGAMKAKFQYWTTRVLQSAETRYSTSLAYGFARALSCSESVSPCGALGRDLNF
jgi:hypothetical protein